MRFSVAGGRSFGFNNTKFVYMYDDGSADTPTMSFEGGISVTGDFGNCTKLPSVKVTTPQKLQLNSSADVISGQVSLTDPSGQTAQVVLTSSGASIAVGGLSKSYTYDQLAAFCTLGL